LGVHGASALFGFADGDKLTAAGDAHADTVPGRRERRDACGLSLRGASPQGVGPEAGGVQDVPVEPAHLSEVRLDEGDERVGMSRVRPGEGQANQGLAVGASLTVALVAAGAVVVEAILVTAGVGATGGGESNADAFHIPCMPLKGVDQPLISVLGWHAETMSKPTSKSAPARKQATALVRDAKALLAQVEALVDPRAVRGSTDGATLDLARNVYATLRVLERELERRPE